MLNPLFKEIIITKMTKSYKMALLLSLLTNKDLQQNINVRDIVFFFQTIYMKKPYVYDLAESSNKAFCEWDVNRAKAFIVTNPVNHLVASSKGLFFFEDENFGISDELYSSLDPSTRYKHSKYHIVDRLQYYFFNKFSYTNVIPLS